ncbi:LPXTG cell wall anchor domain-containing protein [Faecalimonas umbilicata]|uniref:LPXTG cell wall anchor domain-containing protein n=1 Tax=Faecalimonas umbilicata TaxID=1912855 RepID=UPI000E3FE5EC|nr:LPXTG cell wall anchor domain-containing protein [Faecalimonas umbilicata]RGC78101.1 LPXTG cell wall anchor domain-containing protein [Lachnospiraceae bacterium AM25-17]RJU65498.1 LPXTG cell wall anchor domain-containing protein [Coprococcus sp. AM27-12LB]
MRKKFVVALVAAMSLTVAGTGTVFAMDKVSAIASEKEHVHGDNCEWVVDKEAWQETIHHEAEYKTVHHEAEGYYEKQQVQVGSKPIYEKQKHAICQTCGGIDIGLYEDPVEGGLSKEYGEHIGYHADRGEFRITIKAKWVDVQVGEEPIYEEKDIWIETKPAWDEQVLVKEAYDEVINHPEEGHWVCNGESQEPDQKPEQPENPDQKPEQPENPDQKPEQPENPDQKPEQPENPDVETPEVPEQKPEAPTTPEENKENVQTQAAETKKEGTTPKTGDTASSLPVAGAGIASLGVALATILKKRK